MLNSITHVSIYRTGYERFILPVLHSLIPAILKKIIIAIFLVLLSSHLSAPDRKYFTIVRPAPDNPYKKLIYAVGIVEAKCDTLAYNEIEQAAGYFQIRPIRLVDYNKQTGSRYCLKDRFNYEISEKIFLYYARQIGPYNLEKIARNWNGSGRQTIIYWNRVKKYI